MLAKKDLIVGKKKNVVTIYDIASEAKVSISTVSRVLNCPENVAPSTRLQVKAVLNKYNYSPNAMARGLVHNSMKTVGILMTDIRNLHFSAAAIVLESLFFRQGYMPAKLSGTLNKKTILSPLNYYLSPCKKI